MKPQPFAASNFLTVPCTGTLQSIKVLRATPTRMRRVLTRSNRIDLTCALHVFHEDHSTHREDRRISASPCRGGRPPYRQTATAADAHRLSLRTALDCYRSETAFCKSAKTSHVCVSTFEVLHT